MLSRENIASVDEIKGHVYHKQNNIIYEMKVYLPILVILVVIVPHVYGETTPDWVKNTAGWWATDAISETEFVNAIQFLVNEGIINTKTNFSSQNDVEEFFEKKVSFISMDELMAEINSHGLRGPEFNIEKPDDVYRIIAVGGSTTFGSGVEDNFSWPALLGESLNELEPSKKIEVINAGVSAATSLQNMNHINQKLINFNPDLIILYEGANDVSCMLPFFHNQNTKWDEDFMLRSCGNYELDKYPELLADRFSTMCTIGVEKNFDVIIILQPNVELKSKILTNQELESYFDRPQNRIVLEDYELMKEYTLLNTKDCNSVNDFTGIFDDYDIQLYYDYLHVGNLGNQIISEHIRDLTLPVLFEKGILDKIPNNLEKVTKFKFVLNEKLSDSDFSKQDLKEESFFGADLKGSDFEKADLSNADFRLANLENTNFENAKIDNIKLQQNILDNAKFTNVSFKNVNVEYVDFSYTDLSGANFSGNVDTELRDLTNTFFYSSNLSDVDFSYTKLNNAFLTSADLSNANLEGASLVDTHLEGANLEGANLYQIAFSYADLSNAKMPIEIRESNFKSTMMNEIDLSDRKITGSVFYYTNLKNANLENADFSNENYEKILFGFAEIFSRGLSNSELEKMIKESITPFPTIQLLGGEIIGNSFLVKYTLYNNLFEANLEGANMRNADLTYADLMMTNLSNADLTNANLKDANLEGANLEGANLEGANLEGANLEGANLTGADLSGAKLDNTLLDNAILTDATMPE